MEKDRLRLHKGLTRAVVFVCVCVCARARKISLLGTQCVLRFCSIQFASMCTVPYWHHLMLVLDWSALPKCKKHQCLHCPTAIFLA